MNVRPAAAVYACMDAKTIVILGYGHVGRLLAEILLKQTSAHIFLAGRHPDRAGDVAAELNAGLGERRVSVTFADASEPRSLRETFTGADVVVMASSTLRFARNVASAALEAHADYFDVLYSPEKSVILTSMSDDIKKAGLCFISDCGIAPGLTTTLVRLVSGRFDSIESVRLGTALRVDWTLEDISRETVAESIRVLASFRHLIYKGGRWQAMGPLGMLTSMDFGAEMGRQNLAIMFLEELRAIPQLHPQVREVRFAMGGFNWFTTWVAFPVALASQLALRGAALGPVSRFVRWSFKRFSAPPYGTYLKLETRGTSKGRPKAVDVTVRHNDGYILTAASVASCMMQYFDGSIRKPGVWIEANVVDPERTMRDLLKFGAEVEISEGTLA